MRLCFLQLLRVRQPALWVLVQAERGLEGRDGFSHRDPTGHDFMERCRWRNNLQRDSLAVLHMSTNDSWLWQCWGQRRYLLAWILQWLMGSQRWCYRQELIRIASPRHCYDRALLVIVETEQERQHEDHT